MKLAFSTLGCPEFGWSDVYSMAKDLGFQALRSAALEMSFLTAKPNPSSRKTCLRPLRS